MKDVQPITSGDGPDSIGYCKGMQSPLSILSAEMKNNILKVHSRVNHAPLATVSKSMKE